jgi:hypothetical protein
MESRQRDEEQMGRSVRARTDGSDSSDESGDELPDAGLGGGARTGDVEAVFGSDSLDGSGDELHGAGLGGGARTGDVEAVFGSDSLDGSDVEDLKDTVPGALAHAEPVHDNAATMTKGVPSRGLLSEMIHNHKVLGPPKKPDDPTTIVISATKGPIAFREFSNLRGPQVTATGEWLVPEDAYQSARFTDEFGKLVDWWHRLREEDNRMEKLKKIRGTAKDISRWNRVPGIFSKLLKTAISEKLPGGGLVMRTGRSETKTGKLTPLGGAGELFKEAGLDFPGLSGISNDRLEQVMQEAIRKKLTSPEFKAYLSAASETFRRSGELPFWVAESPSRTGTDKWTLDKAFPQEYRKSHRDDEIP